MNLVWFYVNAMFILLNFKNTMGIFIIVSALSVLVSAIITKGRIILFVSISDAVFNAICCGIVALVFASVATDDVACTTAITVFIAWGVLIFLSLWLSNSKSLFKAFFGIPAKMFCSGLFLISSAGLISAIFRKQDSIGKRLGKGTVSGLALYLCSKFIKKSNAYVSKGIERCSKDYYRS